jgi:hypothetical protein
MKYGVATLMCFFTALALPNIAPAQFDNSLRPLHLAGVFNPVVGSGARYEMVSGRKKFEFDVSVVEKDPSGGYWMEDSFGSLLKAVIRTGPETAGVNALGQPAGTTSSGESFTAFERQDPARLKTLMAAEGNDGIVQRLIIQLPGDDKPIDYSFLLTNASSLNPIWIRTLDSRSNAQNIGTESVTTKAGTFSCQHWRTANDAVDFWISDKVTPWSLVKMRSKDGDTITLRRVLSNTKTQVRGAPIKAEVRLKGHDQSLLMWRRILGFAP